jgi:hypothetical protein
MYNPFLAANTAKDPEASTLNAVALMSYLAHILDLMVEEVIVELGDTGDSVKPEEEVIVVAT